MQSPLLILLGLTTTVVAAPLSTDVALHHRRAASETSFALDNANGFDSLFRASSAAQLTLDEILFLNILGDLAKYPNMPKLITIGLSIFNNMSPNLNHEQAVKTVNQDLQRLQTNLGITFNPPMLTQAIAVASAQASASASASAAAGAAAGASAGAGAYSSYYNALHGSAGFNTLFGVGSQSQLQHGEALFLQALAQLGGVHNVSAFTSAGLSIFNTFGRIPGHELSASGVASVAISLQAQFGVGVTAGLLAQAVAQAASQV